MKNALIGLCLLALAALPESARAAELLKCQMNSAYLNIVKVVVVDLSKPDESVGSWQDGKVWRVAWSVSECDDNSELEFDAREFLELREGKRKDALAKFHHAEPDIEINASVYCSITRE